MLDIFVFLGIVVFLIGIIFFSRLKRIEKYISNTTVLKLNNLNYQVIILNKSYRLQLSEARFKYDPTDLVVKNDSKIYNFPEGTQIEPEDNFYYHIIKSVLDFLENERINQRRKIFEKEMFDEISSFEEWDEKLASKALIK